ncbi:MAG: serine/threonine-protein kinase [Acidobacteriota bacterium]
MANPIDDPAARWKNLEPLMLQALELAPEERSAFLRQATPDEALRREVRSLLAEIDETDPLFDQPAAERLDTPAGSGLRQAGPYRVLRPLGEGGMSSVYLAERIDGVHSARVALKQLHEALVTPAMIRRFEAEREILATLRHPNIAQLLDGGTTAAGRPYLVMERVEGLPIDTYCARHQLALDQRIDLLIKVCQAVHYAHQNLVVHRDLKPGNILVTEAGEPKLLDFGIAKLLDPESFPRTVVATHPGQTPMTPAYASPEQITGQPITTATDVYALGVLAYELLCGTRPFSAQGTGSFDLLQAICQADPPRPSSKVDRQASEASSGLPQDRVRLRRALSGDLDNIVLKALNKEPERRYPSAEQLAADFAHYRRGEPVSARRRSWRYVVGKFVRRNRLPVAATSAGILALVVTLIALVLQRRETLVALDRAEFTSRFLVDQFRQADPWERSDEVTAGEFLERGVERLDGLEAPPSVRAELGSAMGLSLLGVGRVDEARRLLNESLRHFEAKRDAVRVAELHLSLAELEILSGRFEESLRQAQASLELQEGQVRNEADTVRSMAAVGKALEKLGLFDEAQAMLEAALERAADGALSPEILGTVTEDLGSLLSRQGAYERAEQIMRQTLALWTEEFGGDHPRTAYVMNSLSSLMSRRGDLAAAADLLQATATILQRSLGEDHPVLIVTLTNLGHVRQKQGDFETAAATYTRVLEICGESPSLRLLRARALNRQAFLLQELDRHAESEEPLLEALALRRAALGSSHPDVMKSLVTLGLLRKQQRDFDRADNHFAEALAIVAATYGSEHPRNGILNRHRANLRLDRAQIEERDGNADAARHWNEAAMGILEQWLSFLEARLGSDNHQVAAFYNTLGGARLQIGDYAEGRLAFRRAIDMMSRALGSDHRKVALYRYNLAYLEREAGEPAAALEPARRAKAHYDTAPSASLRDRVDTDLLIARCELALDKPAAAEEVLSPWLSREEAAKISPRTKAAVVDVLVQAAEAQQASERAERYRRWLARD